jgi:hypothetical protein
MEFLSMKQPNLWPPRGRFASPSLAFLIAAVLTAAALFASCSQSPLFFDISKEVAPKDPIIPGSPSKMVASAVTGTNRLYIANGYMWSYDGASWTRTTQPSGTVRDLAATTSALYALTVDGTSSTTTRLWKTTDGTTWAEVTKDSFYNFIDSIYGAKDTLFVGAHPTGSTDTYGIFYDNGVTLTPVQTGLGSGGALVGAVWDGTNYYVATASLGIFYGTTVSALTTATAISGTTPSNYSYSLNGLIALTGQIVAVGRHNSNGGYLIAGTSAGFTTYISGNSYKFDGALALATYRANQLLLLGGSSGIYSNGYMEIVLSGGKVGSAPSLQSPGNGSTTTVTDNAKYAASLGKKLVNQLFQYPQSDGILFASTNLYGLWAYRNNEWNAQD